MYLTYNYAAIHSATGAFTRHFQRPHPLQTRPSRRIEVRMRAEAHPFAAASGGPPTAIEHHLLGLREAIETWFQDQWQRTSPPLYCSVDLRNAGFKLSPVDTNLFPAGFNNLHRTCMGGAVEAVRAALARLNTRPGSPLLLIPENHTRNRFYLDNIGSLAETLRAAGFTVRIGSLLPEPREPPLLPASGRVTVQLEPVTRRADRLGIRDYEPAIVLLNNDLSAGVPPILENIEQPIVPPVEMGWAHRRKSEHFAKYSILAEEFCQLLRMDRWSIDPLFRVCADIDFRQRRGEDRIADAVDQVLADTRHKYKQNGIDRPAFAVIKANAGTYGMGVMTIRSADEVRQLTHRQRNKMAVGKDKVPVSQVLVQEGVATIESVSGNAAEPVIYMIGSEVIGGFYRIHSGKGSEDNLNAPGMMFVPMPLTEADATAEHLPAARRYAYSVIGRLAALAAGREIRDATSGSPR